MKKYYSKIETKGLPGGPNEQFTYITGIFSSDVFSTEGYKRNSPDKNNPYNIIPSGNITMEGVDFPVMGMDNLGNTKAMMPGNDYKFPGDTVFETPMYKRGGGLLTKTMKCNSCGWSWKAADGGNDVTTCHKCGGEALPKAQGGGSKNKEPIIVPPGDPRAQAYADSLTLYNKGRKDAELIKPLLKDKGYLTWDEYFKTSSNPVNYATNPNIVVSDFGDAWLRIMELNQENPDFGRGTRKIQFPVGDDIASTNIFDYHLYAKPVQPVKVDPDKFDHVVGGNYILSDGTVAKGFNEWKPKRTTPDPNRSVADNLKLMGEDTSFTNRKKLFLDAGLGDTYTGTAEQNVLLNKWLHDGRPTNTTEETVQDNPYKGSTNDITSTNTNNEQTTQESTVDENEGEGTLWYWGYDSEFIPDDSYPGGGYQKRIKRKIPIEGSAPQYQTGGGTVKGAASSNEYQQGGEIIPDNVKKMKAALDKELEAVKNYNLTPTKKNKLIQELYAVYNENVPPKFKLGGPVLSTELQMYKDYIMGKNESPEALKNYDKLNRIHYKKAKANNTSPANYIMTELIS